MDVSVSRQTLECVSLKERYPAEYKKLSFVEENFGFVPLIFNNYGKFAQIIRFYLMYRILKGPSQLDFSIVLRYLLRCLHILLGVAVRDFWRKPLTVMRLHFEVEKKFQILLKPYRPWACHLSGQVEFWFSWFLVSTIERNHREKSKVGFWQRNSHITGFKLTTVTVLLYC